jgi:signal transduction histidine kinase
MLRERRRQLLLVSMLVVAIMVISLGVLMHTMVTMPIRRLVQGMQKVESGDLLFRIHSKRKDEIGQLTSQFNHMVKELADSSEKNYVLIAEIEQFNKNLQQRVDETTAELKDRNLELQDVNGRLMMMQRRLMDAERLTTLGQVVVNIAHEIGSPLGAISGHIQLMKTEPGLSPEITKRLDIVDQQINRVVNIIEQMLNSVREKTPESQPVDIKNILDSVLYLVSPLLSSQHIRLQVHMQEGLPKIMMTDESLQQVVLNLINNAIDAMPQGGELHISTELIAGKDDFQKDMVQIQIRDQGMGIKPGDINQIFKPFFTTKPSGEGTGMGLALCKDIVEKYHGKITCQSQLGQGTVFRILFPVQADSA